MGSTAGLVERRNRHERHSRNARRTFASAPDVTGVGSASASVALDGWPRRGGLVRWLRRFDDREFGRVGNRVLQRRSGVARAVPERNLCVGKGLHAGRRLPFRGARAV